MNNDRSHFKLCIYGKLIIDRVNNNMICENLYNIGSWKNWIHMCRRINWNLSSYHICRKINSKWIKDLNLLSKTVKLLTKKQRTSFFKDCYGHFKIWLQKHGPVIQSRQNGEQITYRTWEKCASRVLNKGQAFVTEAKMCLGCLFPLPKWLGLSQSASISNFQSEWQQVMAHIQFLPFGDLDWFLGSCLQFSPT